MHNKTIIQTCATLARTIAECRSADPNTKVGACLYDPERRDFHLGYNGFPSGIKEDPVVWNARTPTHVFGFPVPITKYNLVNHAEANAAYKAVACRGSRDLSKCFIVVTHYPCHRCLIDHLLPAGIRTIFYLDRYPPDPISDHLWSHYNIAGGFLEEP